MLCVKNVVSENTERTQTVGVRRQGAEENIWSLRGRN
jgi:hypothetical protein